uniref:Reverse transcriptase Ty1/copia-type domain-containing protein n=1 Tax=Tanacetum cinerariifolium TaxID=118510 RepID=A0A6L2L6M8_TANCI|nr:hypothetical protein [Tanacetum cinerariifolium]
MQDKAKEICMVSFRLLHSHLKALSNNDLKGTYIEGGFQRAFVTLFDQDFQSFTRSMFLNLDQLGKQLDKEEYQEIGSFDAFDAFRRNLTYAGNPVKEILLNVESIDHRPYKQETHYKAATEWGFKVKSFGKCVSCISSKTAQKSFTHVGERANDLLRLIHIGVDKTPYEIWKGKVLNLSYLKVWGCYYFYYPDENKIYVARYAKFFESSLISQEASGSIVDFDEIQRQDAQPSKNTSERHHVVEHENIEPQSDVTPISRSTRIPQVLKRYGFYVDVDEHELGDHGEPANYRAALSDPKFDKWVEAMNVEMQSMKDNQVQNLVDLPPNSKTVRSKWLFKKKTDVDDNVHTYKARLVAKGYA